MATGKGAKRQWMSFWRRAISRRTFKKSTTPASISKNNRIWYSVRYDIPQKSTEREGSDQGIYHAVPEVRGGAFFWERQYGFGSYDERGGAQCSGVRGALGY